MYDFLATYELSRDPGGEYQYSNLISLLGYGLALRAGKPYAVLLRERVLGPLGMTRTAGTPTPEMARTMTRGTDALGRPQPPFVAPAFVPSGALRSTMSDMLDFAAANLAADTVGIGASLREARSPRRGPINADGDFAALGWATDSLGTAAGHSGGTLGYNSFIYVDARARRAIVVLASTRGRSANELGVHLLNPAAVPRPKAPAPRDGRR